MTNRRSTKFAVSQRLSEVLFALTTVMIEAVPRAIFGDFIDFACGAFHFAKMSRCVSHWTHARHLVLRQLVKNFHETGRNARLNLFQEKRHVYQNVHCRENIVRHHVHRFVFRRRERVGMRALRRAAFPCRRHVRGSDGLPDRPNLQIVHGRGIRAGT